MLKIWITTTLTVITVTATNSYAPFNLTWLVIAFSDGSIINSTSKIVPKETWFPDIGFDLLKVMDPGAGRGPPAMGRVPFYVCPDMQGDRKRAKTCGDAEAYYCASWGCETQGSWKTTDRDALIEIIRDPGLQNNCKPSPYRPMLDPSQHPLNRPKQPCIINS